MPVAHYNATIDQYHADVAGPLTASQAFERSGDRGS
jgi:hypothetical protein